MNSNDILVQVNGLNNKIQNAAAGAVDPTSASVVLAHGSTGTELKPLKVNATGQLEIDIEDVTIGTDGLALEAKQDTMINATVRDINNTGAIGDGSSQASAMCLGYDRTNGQGRSILVDSGGKVEVNASMTAGHGLSTESKQDDLINATNRAINNTDSIGDGSTNATTVALGYDRSGGKGRALLVDADGHLQVDVLSTTGADTRIKGNDGADGSGTDRIILTDGNGALIVDPSKEGLVSANGTTTAMHTMMLATNDGTNLRTVACDANGVLTVDGSASTQPVSGTVAVSGVAGTVSVDGSGVTQPISASALPLPSGASTSALQSTGNTSLATIAGDTTSIDGKITACNTGAVVVSSSALPSGASTSALQSTGNTSLSTIAGDTTSIDGKITACNTGAVVVASGAITETNSTAILADTASLDSKITACNTGAVVVSSGSVNATLTGIGFSSELTIMNNQTIANSATATTTVARLTSITSSNPQPSFSITATANSFDAQISVSQDNSSFEALDSKIEGASSPKIVGLESFNAPTVEYYKITITNQSGGSAEYTVKAGGVGLTMAAP